jgi:hypothetical protein
MFKKTMENRTDVINFLIDKYNYKTYLEIGVANTALNFTHVNAEHKVGVDPGEVGGIQYNITSDDFFTQNRSRFDIIFIDGMHEYHHVYRDITNSLKCLNDNGIVVMHDCNPTTEAMQLVPNTSDGNWSDSEWQSFVEMRSKITDSGEWTGDTWKAFVKFRTETQHHFMCVVDIDYGIGIVKPTSKLVDRFVNNDILSYDNLVKNKSNWLNLIAPGQLEFMLDNV